MLKGWSFVLNNPESFKHGLGFSALIALTFVLSNSHSLVLFKIFLAIGHGVSSYLVARIGMKIGLPKKYWVLAAILFAIDPFIFIAATNIQTESLTTLLVLYWGLIAIKLEKIPLRWNYNIVLFPISGFYSAFMRPNSILPFLIISGLIYYRWYHQKVKIEFISISISIFIFLILSYEIFLTRLYSGFFFLSPVGGDNALVMCRTEFIPQYLGVVSSSENKKINYFAMNGNEMNQFLTAHPNLTISEINQEFTRAGVSTCLAHPFESIGVLFIKSIALWRPFTVFGAYGPKMFLISLCLWTPLTLATIWFVMRKDLGQTSKDLRNFFLGLGFGFTVSLLLTPTQIRHRIAFAEPFYWLFFMYLIHQKHLKNKKLKTGKT